MEIECIIIFCKFLKIFYWQNKLTSQHLSVWDKINWKMSFTLFSLAFSNKGVSKPIMKNTDRSWILKPCSFATCIDSLAKIISDKGLNVLTEEVVFHLEIFSPILITLTNINSGNLPKAKFAWEKWQDLSFYLDY